MNKERRNAIAEARQLIEDAQGKLDDARSILESARDEEQDYYDNMPESFQQGEKGGVAQEAVDALEAAVSELEGWDFDSVFSSLEDAVQ